MKMSNVIYDVLKWIAIIVLPALSTLITSVFPLWGLPYGSEIAQTITAVATFLGAILVVSNANYNKRVKETNTLFRDSNNVD